MRPEATHTLLVRRPWGESVPCSEQRVGHVATRYRRASSAGYVPTRSHRIGR